jgi:short-subunit dehydrogenase
MELRGTGSPVRVQALCPGFTRTEFHETLGLDPGKIPGFLWLDADQVVQTSLSALAKRKAIVIPDWKYKLAATLMKHLPERIVELGRPGGKRV